MKKSYCFISVIFALLAMSACTADELTYSCNKDVDGWVKDNLTEIHEMTRSEWLKMDEGVSIAVYRAFTPDQKIRFWQEKFIEVKNLPWNAEELKHIELAEQFLNTHQDYFDEGKLSDEQLDEVETFSYKWIRTGIEQLGWDDAVVISIVMTGFKVKNTKGEVIRPISSYSDNVIEVSVERECHCNSGILNSCGLSQETCSDFHCIEVDKGCGFLFLYTCDARCE